MTVTCVAPDADLGVAVRLAGYLDCQARALGENGFQAMAGGPIAAGLLAGLVTIFVALIGYRLILGQTPSLRDGVGWAVRLGIVLTLTTSWPAFQTLFYRVAADSPGELAAVLLPASGLPTEGLDDRVQVAYDIMRLGSSPLPPPQAAEGGNAQASGQPTAGAQPQPAPTASIGQPPLPQTASMLVISTEGVLGGLRIAIGFLLAIGPLVCLALLFDGTLGLFSGWVRALAGSALALLGATIVTAIDLVVIESELAKLQSYARGGIAEVVDQQALTTIVLLFAVAMLIVVLASVRVAGAFRLPSRAPDIINTPEPAGWNSGGWSHPSQPSPSLLSTSGAMPVQTRVATVADALALTVRREQGASMVPGQSSTASASRTTVLANAPARESGAMLPTPLGLAGRRSLSRQSRSAQARDRLG